MPKMGQVRGNRNKPEGCRREMEEEKAMHVRKCHVYALGTPLSMRSGSGAMC